MNNLFIAISDVHLSLRTLDVALRVLEQALQKAKELEVPLVIAGDLNDTKAMMRSEWVSALIKLFSEYQHVRVHIIDGNHDLNNKTSSQSSLAFLHLIPNVYVYHSYQEVEFGGIPFGLLPYQSTNKSFLEQLEKIAVNKLICHQGFFGAFMGDYVVDDSSVDPKVLDDFEIVLSGHYHKHQWVQDNLMYFGSPFTVNFGEAGQEKFIWQIYEAKGKIHTQPILTNVRKHIQATITSNDIPQSLLDSNTEDLIKIIQKGPKEFALKKLDFSSIPSQNIIVVPEIDRQSEVRLNQELAHQPLQVIDQYLDNAITDFEKKELKEFLLPHIQPVLSTYINKTNRANKVISVEATNFLSYKELKYDYTSKGLTLVEGHDDDLNISTGAGKSSFLDAICYVLFGKTSKEIKADEVINRQEKKNLSIKLALQTLKGTMHVVRYRKHKEHENSFYFYYNINSPITGKDNRETQKLLEEELGLDFDMFLRSSYFTQFGSIDRFLSASDTEKKKVIAEICDTKIYDDMVQVLKDALKNLQAIYIDVEKKFISIDSELEVRTQLIGETQQSLDQFEKTRQSNIQSHQKNLDMWEKKHLENLEDIKNKINNFDATKQRQINNAKDLLKTWQNTQVQKVDGLKIKKKSLEDELSSLNVNIEDKPDFETQSLEVEKKLKIIEKLEKEATSLNNQIYQIDLSIKNLESQISTLGKKAEESVCIECFQPISKDILAKQQKQVSLRIDNLKRDRSVLQIKFSEIITATKVKDELIQQNRSIVAASHEYDIKAQAVKSAQQQAHKVQQEIINIDQEITTILEDTSNPYQQQIDQLASEVNPHLWPLEKEKAEENPFINAIKVEEQLENPFASQLDSAKAQYKTTKEKLDKLVTEKNIVESDINKANWWKDAIHVYIKSYLIDSYIEHINTLVNQKMSQVFDSVLSMHLSATSDNKKSSKEKISVTIYNKNEECSYQSLSGGERCRVCLALNLAIAETTNVNFGFLMFDEVLNGLDDVGKAQVMRVFKELESQYESVFVIDHTTEFKSLFTNNIMVRKSNGVSSIVV